MAEEKIDPKKFTDKGNESFILKPLPEGEIPEKPEPIAIASDNPEPSQPPPNESDEYIVEGLEDYA